MSEDKALGSLCQEIVLMMVDLMSGNSTLTTTVVYEVLKGLDLTSDEKQQLANTAMFFARAVDHATRLSIRLQELD